LHRQLSPNQRTAGRSALKEFSFTVYDGCDCGNDSSGGRKIVPNDPYAFHRKMADLVKGWFDVGNLPEIRAYLSTNFKNRFIIEQIEKQGKPKTILEIGCSLGYLTTIHFPPHTGIQLR
jgi:hypothetical protein